MEFESKYEYLMLLDSDNFW